MSSKPKPESGRPKPEPARVTIYGKRVERVEMRGENHYAVFDDGTDLAISGEAYGRIAERLRGGTTISSTKKSSAETTRAADSSTESAG